ncbi:unnamed protein product [Cylindrotheca closterium]|uniref:L-aspartate oxidase n=1 Tax=Cylindrotheca closterium TaxID=2856 RepID=A0AAD2CDR5_9STRA|nr:unnamed protein product [Cylindrotheca closterium]
MIRSIRGGLPSFLAKTKTQSSRRLAATESTLRKWRASHRSFASSTAEERKNDRLLVVGSGVAGSAAALIAAETYQIPVTVLFAGSIPQDCNSNWAQGGIIYRNYDPASGDSADSLAKDIHRAGAGLCDEGAVRKVSEEGPSRVRELLLTGGPFANVPFDKAADGELALCLEASHGAPRILHYADHTGMIITRHITKAAANHPLITMQSDTLAVDIIQEDGVCIGIQTFNRATGETEVELASRGTVLASGGLAGIYEHSTNPAGFNALGSSVGLATRAGVETKDLEYVQFHPTSLFIPNESRFLLSEALRGEGAILRNASGRAFGKDFHPDGELAPRDIVARGVFEESQNGDGTNHNAFLDISHRDADWLHARFPTIQAYVSERGLDLAKDHLPIIPAAHYTCGGIATDEHGRTSLKGLYAAGEAARTGLHGGNRLASTSLLEALVYGASVADFVGSDMGRELHSKSTERLSNRANAGFDLNVGATAENLETTAMRATQLLSQVRRVMWDNVGLVRTTSGLAGAIDSLNELQQEAVELHEKTPLMETIGLRDAACSGQAVAQAAIGNKVSAGGHYLSDAEEFSDDDDEAAVAAR